MPEQFENGREFHGKNSLQDLNTKEMYLHPKNRSVSFQKSGNCPVFIIFDCSDDAVSKMVRS